MPGEISGVLTMVPRVPVVGPVVGAVVGTLAVGSVAQSGCRVTVLDQSGIGCVTYDLSALPQRTFNLSDSWPEPYLVAPPCAVADTSGCPPCKDLHQAAGVVQLIGPPGRQLDGCAGTRCIPCDGVGDSNIRSKTAALNIGLNLTYGGGEGGRSVTYQLICDPSAPADNPPEPHVLTNPAYRVVWKHPAACGKAVSPGPNCVIPEVPRPSTAQLAWQAREIGALIHFNMMTFDSCGQPDLFNPTKLNTSQWADSLEALGAKEAVLVAKHGCGFVLWPSKATVPGGGRYNYSVAYSKWAGGEGDVLRDFLASCNARGISTGFYYSLASNSFAGKMQWSSEELISIEKQQLLELWSASGYGNQNHGGHGELWFDGGFEGEIQPFVKENLASLQPSAAVFNGCAQQGAGNNASLCVSPNAVRWIGTEAGTAPDPDWSTGYSGGGDPSADVFQPAECDTTLQNGDAWFYNPSIGIRSLATLIGIYHNTVGRNGFLMLDFAPNQEGLIAPDQAVRYAELGSWIRGCYSQAVASANFSSSSSSFELEIPQGSSFDRVVLRENQVAGQLIRGYVVEVLAQNATDWVQVVTGQSVGNKWIHLLDNASGITANQLRVRITQAAPGKMAEARLTSLAVHKCNRPTDKGCSISKGFKFTYSSAMVISTSSSSTTDNCCNSCSANAACAVFLLSPENECILLSADGVQVAASGWIAGSPNN